MIQVDCKDKKCILSRLYSTYPMKLLRQSAFHIINDEYISIIILGYGGGLVQGDKNVLSIDLNKDAKLSLRTQGSTKIFKCNNGKACINNLSATLSENSILAYFPDPTTCYPGSRYKQSYQFNLELSSSLILVDWFTSGRQNRDIDWNIDEFENKTIIKRKDKIVYIENMKLSNNEFGNISNKLGDSNVFGSIVLIGPHSMKIVERLQVFTHRQSYYEYRKDFSYSYHDQHKSIISVTNLNYNTSTSTTNTITTANSTCIYDDLITIVRFSLPTVEEGYELLAEIFKPMSMILTYCEPYYDRLSATTASNTTTSSSLPLETIGSHEIISNTPHSNDTKKVIDDNDVDSKTSSSRLVNILRKYDMELRNTKSLNSNICNDRNSNKDIDISNNNFDIHSRFNDKPTKLQRLN